MTKNSFEALMNNYYSLKHRQHELYKRIFSCNKTESKSVGVRNYDFPAKSSNYGFYSQTESDALTNIFAQEGLGQQVAGYRCQVIDIDDATYLLTLAINQETKENQQILYLRFAKNATLQEIAVQLDCTASTVWSRLQRLEKRISERLISLQGVNTYMASIGNKPLS